MKLHLPYYLIATALMISCSQSVDDTTAETINFEQAKPLAEIIDSTRFVVLGDEKHTFSGRIDKLMAKGDTIFISDIPNTNSLNAYRTNGDFLFQVGRKGRGPNEYIEMSSFTIDDKNIYCLDNGKQLLVTYDINTGQYISEQKIPAFYAADFAKFDDGSFLFYYGDTPQNGGGAFITNDKFEKTNYTLPTTDENYCELSTINAFTQTADKIVYTTYANDSIYIFDRKSPSLPVTKIALDFGKHHIKGDARSNSEELSSYMHSSGAAYLYGDLLISDVNIPTQQQADYFMYGSYLYNMDTEMVYLNARMEDVLSSTVPVPDNYVFWFAGVVGDEIVSQIESYDRYQELVKLGMKRAPENIEQQLEKGEPILVFHRLIMN